MPARATPQPSLPVSPHNSTFGQTRVSRPTLVGVPSHVLDAASRRVAAQWREEVGDPSEIRDVTETLGHLTTAVYQRQTAADAPVDERTRSTLGRRLLELLRAEVVRGWAENGVADTAMPVLLLAMERVRESIEPGWAQSLAAHLAGTDGLELLVHVAHDLRSPLTSILLLAETLQRGQSGAVNDLQRRQLGLIYTAGLGLSSVASDLIALEQGGEQLVEPEPVPFSVTAALESVRDIVRPIAEEKRLTVRLLAPTNDQRIGHPVALSRILLNLTTNALKFTDQGYVEIVAQETGGGGAGSRIEFAVRDSGRGIPTDKITTLFQPLRKEAGRRGQLFSQTGLGLTICRKLATALKSELKVESRTGWGTRFYFEVDAPIAPARRSGARAAPRVSGRHPVRNSGSHISRRSSGAQDPPTNGRPSGPHGRG